MLYHQQLIESPVVHVDLFVTCSCCWLLGYHGINGVLVSTKSWVGLRASLRVLVQTARCLQSDVLASKKRVLLKMIQVAGRCVLLMLKLFSVLLFNSFCYGHPIFRSHWLESM